MPPYEKTLTEDTVFRGELICLQHEQGYRFSVDAVLLAHLARVRRNWQILDLGCGNGIISLILLYRWQGLNVHVTGIERQHALAELATINIGKNGFQSHCSIITGDIRKIEDYVRPESFDMVICNPPFYPANQGRQNTHPEERAARHQLHGSLEDFLRSAFYAVKNRGEVNIIYPAEQLQNLLYLAVCRRLPAKRAHLIYSYPDPEQAARLVVVRCVKNGQETVTIAPPLYIHSAPNGPYTATMAEFFATGRETLAGE
jgi:tRNA1Val (adenine37-N6)-methyltransferase